MLQYRSTSYGRTQFQHMYVCMIKQQCLYVCLYQVFINVECCPYSIPRREGQGRGGSTSPSNPSRDNNLTKTRIIHIIPTLYHIYIHTYCCAAEGRWRKTTSILNCKEWWFKGTSGRGQLFCETTDWSYTMIPGTAVCRNVEMLMLQERGTD